MEPVLKVSNLTIEHRSKKYSTSIVHGIDFEVMPGQCLGILGESGSGKSMSLKGIMGLLGQGFTVEGEAIFQGENLIGKSREQLRKIRGKRIGMILQNPMTCFDPLYRIDEQLAETYREHKSLTKAEILDQSVEVLTSMRISNPREVLKKYPHQLSGGMLQRIMIGLAMSMEPDLIIADEPTTAIDAITQYEIMKEFVRIKKQSKISMIFISHDLGVISAISDQVLVLNQGSVADKGTFSRIYENPQDPYTRLLVEKKRAVMEKYHQAVRKKGGIGL
ncbi:ABC transporter ATP-binding protein [Lacrimispora xylanolytica]|uniref:ABC transporter ATP-binding protein n=1 Tax=Lacrimispora xylanolytica TaxID=29375 RepID=A0ABY7AAL8_9FIRM|nr:ABC transporter ATP-binding protein [Lacrimispora xylanolytica]WAJ23720.1 ABC transporter ATP-binding protein [Lacrimispora xylanolytica]